MCRKAHVDVSGPIAIGILEHYAETVWKNIEIKRISLYVRIYLRLVVHRDRQKDNILIAVPIGHPIQIGNLAMADLATRRPERQHDHFSLQAIQIVRFAVKALA
jgi:hypothetical protein